jgi:hypothetical protein
VRLLRARQKIGHPEGRSEETGGRKSGFTAFNCAAACTGALRATETRARPATLTLSVLLPLKRGQAFAQFWDELTRNLLDRGLALRTGRGGHLGEADRVNERIFGKAVRWQPPRSAALEWHEAWWAPACVSRLDFRFSSLKGVTLLTLEFRGWGSSLGENGANSWVGIQAN